MRLHRCRAGPAQYLRYGPQMDVECSDLGGLPPEEFLRTVDPLLAGVRAKLQGRYATSDQIAGRLSPHWAAALGLRPVSLFLLEPSTHIGMRSAQASACGDVVNVVGTSTCIIAVAEQVKLIPGVCGVVRGSAHPKLAGIEAGLSATGDIFDAIARRAGTKVETLSRGLEKYKAGQTGCCE